MQETFYNYNCIRELFPILYSPNMYPVFTASPGDMQIKTYSKRTPILYLLYFHPNVNF